MLFLFPILWTCTYIPVWFGATTKWNRLQQTVRRAGKIVRDPPAHSPGFLLLKNQEVGIIKESTYSGNRADMTGFVILHIREQTCKKVKSKVIFIAVFPDKGHEVLDIVGKKMVSNIRIICHVSEYV